jgi:peptidoglycan hydrolase-like amidase
VRWKWIPLLLAVPLSSSLTSARDVRIGVLGIFHPHQLILSSRDAGEIVVTASGRTFFLQPGSSTENLQIRASGDVLLLSLAGKEIRAKELHAAGRNQDAISFVLGVPGKIERRYRGTLDIKIADGVLVPVITMDLETAVASVVQAESLTGTLFEALKAQAVVTRSYFAAGAVRHAEFDFCDLTHCQFLREAPRLGSPAARATEATRDLIITFDDKPVAAMFTRSCGGHTLTPADIGIPSGGYPYFSVVCDFCYKNPVRWSRRVTPEDAALLFDHHEAARLAVGRRLGWNAVPSNTFQAQKSDTDVILEGVGHGHGVGLCQRGARAMAEEGADFREIIDHYFPNTSLGHVAPHRPKQSLPDLSPGQ